MVICKGYIHQLVQYLMPKDSTRRITRVPRKLVLTDDQIAFINANIDWGAKWLADELKINRDALLQWGSDNGISLKPHWSCNKKLNWKPRVWPKNYKHYKRFLVERDGLRCHYCDRLMEYAEAQIDHKVPRVRGGTDAPHNLVLACARCNNIKGSACYECKEFRDAIKQ